MAIDSRKPTRLMESAVTIILPRSRIEPQVSTVTGGRPLGISPTIGMPFSSRRAGQVMAMPMAAAVMGPTVRSTARRGYVLPRCLKVSSIAMNPEPMRKVL